MEPSEEIHQVVMRVFEALRDGDQETVVTVEHQRGAWPMSEGIGPLDW